MPGPCSPPPQPQPGRGLGEGSRRLSQHGPKCSQGPASCPPDPGPRGSRWSQAQRGSHFSGQRARCRWGPPQEPPHLPAPAGPALLTGLGSGPLSGGLGRSHRRRQLAAPRPWPQSQELSCRCSAATSCLECPRPVPGTMLGSQMLGPRVAGTARSPPDPGAVASTPSAIRLKPGLGLVSRPAPAVQGDHAPCWSATSTW